MKKAKSPTTPNGNPKLGGELEVPWVDQNNGETEWVRSTIVMVLDYKSPRGPFKGVVLEYDDSDVETGEPFRARTEPLRWTSLDWRPIR